MAHSELKLFDVVMLGPLALALFQYLELAFVPEHYVLWAVFVRTLYSYSILYGYLQCMCRYSCFLFPEI